jgi:hypothetical protein
MTSLKVGDIVRWTPNAKALANMKERKMWLRTVNGVPNSIKGMVLNDHCSRKYVEIFDKEQFKMFADAELKADAARKSASAAKKLAMKKRKSEFDEKAAECIKKSKEKDAEFASIWHGLYKVDANNLVTLEM